MAKFDYVQPSSVDSDHPMSLVSSHSASSVSLMSLISSSNSNSGYRSCIDEMAADETSSDEYFIAEAGLEEPSPEELDVPLEVEVDDQPSTVLIYSVATMPNPSPLPLLSSIFPETVDQAVQSGEHAFL